MNNRQVTMWLVWHKSGGRRFRVGELTYDGDKYSFHYANREELNEAVNDGFTYFPGFEKLDQPYISDHLFSNIASRLPDKARPDFLGILNRYGLDVDADELLILEATKGRLVTDNYEFISPFNAKKIEFNIAGINHRDSIEEVLSELKANDELNLELEPDNKYDHDAVKVIFRKDSTHEYHLGYVPRYYSPMLAKMLREGTPYSALVKRVDFDSDISDEYVLVSIRLVFGEAK